MIDITQLDIGKTVYSTIDIAVYFFIIILALVVIGAVIFFTILIKKFKHKVIIKDIHADTKVVTEDKARVITLQDGVTIWRCLKNKNIVFQEPPASVVEFTSKGNKCVTVYTAGGEVIGFARDTANVNPPPTELYRVLEKDIPLELKKIEDKKEREQKIQDWIQEERMRRRDQWIQEHNIIEAVQPFTPNQRMTYMSLMKTALERKKKALTEYIMPLAYVGSVTILIISGMIFWGDLAKPAIDVNNQRTTQLQIQKDTVETLQEIKQDIQVIRSDINSENKNAQERGVPN